MKFLNFDKVLCIGAHPDDVEYGMVGSMCKFTDTQFDVLILSEGGDFDESTGKSRQMECRNIWDIIPNVSGSFIGIKHVVNHAEDDAPITDAGQSIDPVLVEAQLTRIDEHRKKRDHDIVASRLESLRAACESDDDLFPHILDSVRNGATVGEVMDIMRDVFGTWRAPSGI